MKLHEIRNRFRKDADAKSDETQLHIHKYRDRCFFCEIEEGIAEQHGFAVEFQTCPVPVPHSDYADFCWICGYPKNVMAHHNAMDSFSEDNKPADFVLPMLRLETPPAFPTRTQQVLNGYELDDVDGNGSVRKRYHVNPHNFVYIDPYTPLPIPGVIVQKATNVITIPTRTVPKPDSVLMLNVCKVCMPAYHRWYDRLSNSDDMLPF